METLESAVVSFADMSRMKANLWNLTCETRHVEDLCERMGNLFTTHEKSCMSFMTQDRLKCLSLYAKILENERSVEYQKALLEALKETGNALVAERIKGQQAKADTKVLDMLEVTTSYADDAPQSDQPSPAEISNAIRYAINGRNLSHAAPESLRIPKILESTIKMITFTDLQIPLTTLKNLLAPCKSIQELKFLNVLIHGCSSQSHMPLECSLVLPRLRRYSFISDDESSNHYTWNMIIFFSITQDSSLDLLTLWKSNVQLNIRTISMEIVLDDSKFLISIPKEEFYDAPVFVPYIPKEFVRSILQNLNSVSQVICLLPKHFDKLDFKDLPIYTKSLHVSGLNIDYSLENEGKYYERVQLESCNLPALMLDNVTIAFPVAKQILLKNCKVDECDIADIEMTL